MSLGIIGLSAFKCLAVAAMCILLVVALVRNKGVWFKPDVIKDEQWREAAVRYKGWLKALCIGATAVVCWATLSLAAPLIQDIPHIARGEYLQAEGAVVSDSLGGAAGRVQDREFAITDAVTGEEIHLMALSTGLREGEYVKVTYLPNSHLATINYRGGGHDG